MTLPEHSLVVLNSEIPEHRLHAGDVGVIVFVYESGIAYEVEFVAGDGSTLALLTLEPDQIHPIGPLRIAPVSVLPKFKGDKFPSGDSC